MTSLEEHLPLLQAAGGPHPTPCCFSFLLVLVSASESFSQEARNRPGMELEQHTTLTHTFCLEPELDPGFCGLGLPCVGQSRNRLDMACLPSMCGPWVAVVLQKRYEFEVFQAQVSPRLLWCPWMSRPARLYSLCTHIHFDASGTY